jgi:hypothetical protein
MDNDLKRDEARVNLFLGMREWITPTGMATGWKLIEESITILMALEGLGVDDLLKEVGLLEQELEYTDDDIRDLDTSIVNLLIHS